MDEKLHVNNSSWPYKRLRDYFDKKLKIELSGAYKTTYNAILLWDNKMKDLNTTETN